MLTIYLQPIVFSTMIVLDTLHADFSNVEFFSTYLLKCGNPMHSTSYATVFELTHVFSNDLSLAACQHPPIRAQLPTARKGRSVVLILMSPANEILSWLE